MATESSKMPATQSSLAISLANWKSFQRHPLSELFGDMTEVQFEGLCQDVKDNGCDPKRKILIYEGKILDGWQLLRAAVIEHKQPCFETYQGKDPLGEVIRRNFHRRHNDVDERARVAARIANYQRGGDRRSQLDKLSSFKPPNGGLKLDNLSSFKPPNTPLVSREKAAEMCNVPLRAVEDEAKIEAEGTPALREAHKEKIISRTDAATVASEPAHVQNGAVEAVRNGQARTAKEAARSSRQKATGPRTFDDDRVTRAIDHVEELLCERADRLGLQNSKGLAHCLAGVRTLETAWEAWKNGPQTIGQPKRKFTKPTLEEVAAYVKSRGDQIDASSFWNFYQSKGWKVGNAPMRDWKAAVHGWEDRERKQKKPAKTMSERMRERQRK